MTLLCLSASDDLQPLRMPAQAAAAEGEGVLAVNGGVHQAVGVVTESGWLGPTNGHVWQPLIGFGPRASVVVVWQAYV